MNHAEEAGLDPFLQLGGCELRPTAGPRKQSLMAGRLLLYAGNNGGQVGRLLLFTVDIDSSVPCHSALWELSAVAKPKMDPREGRGGQAEPENRKPAAETALTLAAQPRKSSLRSPAYHEGPPGRPGLSLSRVHSLAAVEPGRGSASPGKALRRVSQ
ncbi:hypothetical protein SKAU_G00133360 [Synaphobranchus kaupii]|uniref:Uncharacterized protein n=1 Tax=Synaphobranchus kaupii TaxID=118154 RepID=A0A9Q1J3P8_SYNKA|nr:hypothetical protein SKAU_G00133360 [Synaphobranchus kaupii]